MSDGVRQVGRPGRHEYDAGVWPWPDLPCGHAVIGLEFDDDGLVCYVCPPEK